MSPLLMQTEPEIVFIIPIVAILVGGLIAITTMLTNHQRKMAELLRRTATAWPGRRDPRHEDGDDRPQGPGQPTDAFARIQAVPQAGQPPGGVRALT